MRDSVTNFGRFSHLFRQIFSLSFSLFLLVIVTILTKALIWGSWLLFMCRHPGCQGNQSKVVSKRQHRTLQCSRKTAAPACTQSRYTQQHSSRYTQSHILQTQCLFKQLSCWRVGGSRCGWVCWHQQVTWISKWGETQSKHDRQTVHFLYFLYKWWEVKRETYLYNYHLNAIRVLPLTIWAV